MCGDFHKRNTYKRKLERLTGATTVPDNHWFKLDLLHRESQVSIMILGRLKMGSVGSRLGQTSDYHRSLGVGPQLRHRCEYRKPEDGLHWALFCRSSWKGGRLEEGEVSE